jgi:hypothetical protein
MGANFHGQYSKAVEIAASKVEKKPKEETPMEVFTQMQGKMALKKNKSAKAAAKKLCKKKKIHKISSYFTKT